MMSKVIVQETLRPGVWTQWAELLCNECATVVGHGYKQRIEGGSLGYCDHCGCRISLTEELQSEQALVRHAKVTGFPLSQMNQTGGMCHAAEIYVPSKLYSYDSSYLFLCSCIGVDEWVYEIYAQSELVVERTASSADEILDYANWVSRGHLPVTSADLK